MQQAPRHRVFISFHHEDQRCKDSFVKMMGDNIVDESVDIGDIPQNIAVETIRQNIRDNFIRNASVTIVLIGPGTWQRKHVDWEIGSSLRDSGHNPRCGLLGILLPNHPNFDTGEYNPRLIPPRLAKNCVGDDPYARIYNWTSQPNTVRDWIHTAFIRRRGTQPDNSLDQFANNRSGDYSRGWQ